MQPPTILADIHNVLQYLLELGGLIIVGTIMFSINKVQEAFFRNTKEKIARAARLRPATTQAHQDINSILEALRLSIGAYRVCVRQFHNGDRFMLADHAWKISQTHEALHFGASSTVQFNQSLPVGAMTALVAPILDKTAVVAGTGEIETCSPCKSSCRFAEAGHRVLRFDVSAMEMNAPRDMLTKQGVDVVYVVNLMDENGETFGFISSQFQGRLTPDSSEEERKAWAAFLTAVERKACEMCAAAEKVQFYLTSEFREMNAKPGWFSWLRHSG